MNIPELLYQSRHRDRVTQQAVADELGITKSAYSLFETGRSKIPVKRLVGLCELFCIKDKDMMAAIKQTEKERGIALGEAKAKAFFNAKG